jgi:hypothetical protein
MNLPVARLVAHSGFRRAGADQSAGDQRNLPPLACHSVEVPMFRQPGVRGMRRRGTNIGRDQLN